MTSQTQGFLPSSLWEGKLFTGRWSPASGTITAVEPGSGNAIGRIGMATPDEIGTAAATARMAHCGCEAAWRDAAPEDRAGVLRRAAMLSEEHASEIIDWIVRESGSTTPKAAFELQVTTRALWEAAAMPTQPQGIVLPSTPGRVSMARRRPLGVVGVIAPFNFPLYLAVRAVAPALAVGNAVVLKPDPRTSICGGYVLARLFELAGLPGGVLQVLPGDGAAGARLCEDPNIAMVQFTGSTAAGRRVGETAGRNLKKVSLELGGKNALIVLDDADIELAAANVAWGCYLHSGQICMSAGRILVQDGIAEALTRRIVEKARAMPLGDPVGGQVMIGPIISKGSWTMCTTSCNARSVPAPAWKPAARSTGCSTAPQC